MRPNFNATQFRAGHLGLLPHRFCMPATGVGGENTKGGWYNGAGGRNMLPLALCEKAVEPGGAFRAVLPHGEVLIEVSGPGTTGALVGCAQDGRGIPLDEGTGTSDDPIAGVLLEDATAEGDVVRMLYFPMRFGGIGAELSG